MICLSLYPKISGNNREKIRGRFLVEKVSMKKKGLMRLYVSSWRNCPNNSNFRY